MSSFRAIFIENTINIIFCDIGVLILMHLLSAKWKNFKKNLDKKKKMR